MGLWLPAHALACHHGDTVLASRVGVQTLFITPDSLWENGYIESFNGRLRNELLDLELFDALWEAKVLVERSRQTYYRIRPHSAAIFHVSVLSPYLEIS